MKIKIACVGKVKDAFFRDAVAEYAKRLSRFCTLEIAEVADEKAPETLSPAEEALTVHVDTTRPVDWDALLPPGGMGGPAIAPDAPA